MLNITRRSTSRLIGALNIVRGQDVFPFGWRMGMFLNADLSVPQRRFFFGEQSSNGDAISATLRRNESVGLKTKAVVNNSITWR